MAHGTRIHGGAIAATEPAFHGWSRRSRGGWALSVLLHLAAVALLPDMVRPPAVAPGETPPLTVEVVLERPPAVISVPAPLPVAPPVAAAAPPRSPPPVPMPARAKPPRPPERTERLSGSPSPPLPEVRAGTATETGAGTATETGAGTATEVRAGTATEATEMPPPPVARIASEHGAYAGRLHDRITRHRVYPPQSLRRREEGDVHLRILIDPAGRLLDILNLIEASGHLTRAARHAVESAAPFEPPPPPVDGERHVAFDVTVVFRLH